MVRQRSATGMTGGRWKFAKGRVRPPSDLTHYSVWHQPELPVAATIEQSI